MKTLIAYYSKTGNNEVLCKALAKQLKCDIEKIIPKKESSIPMGAFSAFFKFKTPILNPKTSPADYDLVILSFPVWATGIPSSIRKYLCLNKGKFNNIAIASFSGSNQNEKAMGEIEKITKKKSVATLQLGLEKVCSDKNQLLNYHATEKDLKVFEKEINNFVNS